MQQATSDPVLNPVRQAGALVQRVRSIPEANNDTPIYTYSDEDGCTCIITQDLLLKEFRSAVDAIGEDKLGFKSSEIGTHSNRTAAAMAMFLANTPIFLIMLIGWWSSDAFLKYIRRQVLQSAKGVLSKMI